MTVRKWLAISLCLALVGLTGCTSESGGGDPAQTVERYIQAKVEGNEEAVRGLLCSEMESALSREAGAFATVSDATIEDMACEYQPDISTVACSGQIVAVYGQETTVFPLSTYRVVQEDGEWKWCGEAG